MVLPAAALGWLQSCKLNDAGLELTLLEHREGNANAPCFGPKGVLMAQNSST